MLRTIEEVLGLPPLGLNDGLAEPMSEVFDLAQAEWSYEAIVPEVLRSTRLPLDLPGEQKTQLDARWHTCSCGASCHRDLNAALVLLYWGMDHTLAVLLALIWSQELAPGPRSQNLPLEPVA